MRNSKTFSFTVSDSKGFFTVGEYEDGAPGELFINTSKHGSTLRGLLDAFGISISYGLQHGVPLKTYVRALSHMAFAPSGITDDPAIRTASSIIDYIFHKLALTYLSFDDRLELGLASLDDMPVDQTSLLEEPAKPEPAAQAEPEKVVTVAASTANFVSQDAKTAVNTTDSSSAASQPAKKMDEGAPMCFNCGNQTQRSGSCYVCTSCGSTTGCS